MILPLLGATATINDIGNGISPKVAYPGYVVLIGTVATCALDHYGLHLDPGIVVGVVGSIAIAVGYYVKHIVPTTAQSEPSTAPDPPK